MSTTSAITRHWILNLARESRGRVSDVVPFVEELFLNVRGVPGVAATDYAAIFLDLFDSSAIRLRLTDEEGSTCANRSQLESVLEARLRLPPVSGRKTYRKDGPPILPPAIIRDAPDLAWELSPLGGEEWESMAQPDWNHFATVLSDPESGEMWSANFDLLMAELGWCRELNGIEIDRTTLKLEVLHDSAITYWKVLPVVHHATFCSRWVEHGWPVKGRPDPEWFRNWWRSRGDWYKEPWTLPSWPVG
jgi:hypothetical protein